MSDSEAPGATQPTDAHAEHTLVHAPHHTHEASREREEAGAAHSGGALGRFNIYLCAAILLVAVSIIYWALFVSNAYNIFKYSRDFASHLYSMYFYAHYLSQVNPLQVLVYGNHIAPDQLITFLIYLAFQSPITPPLVQEIVLSLSGLLIFFVARDLLKSDMLGLLLCFVYLLNPGMHGMLIFDYHEEYYFIPFYILAFYYYMKLNKRMFYLSALLLVGVMDIAPLMAITLAVGLGAYEYLSDKDATRRSARLRLSAILICIAIATLVVYNIIYFVVSASEASEANFPTILAVSLEPLVPYYSLSGFSCQQCITSYSQAYGGSSLTDWVIAYGLAVGLLGFGLAFTFEAIPTLIMISPWLAAIAIFQDYEMLAVFAEYFSIVLCGIIVGTLLGFMRLQSRSPRYHALGVNIMGPLAVVTVVIAIALAVAFPYFASISPITPNVTQSYLFNVTPAQQKLYSQLDSMISLVPPNSSIYTSGFIFPHVLNTRYAEIIDGQGSGVYTTFPPEYVLVDFNPYVSEVSNGGSPESVGSPVYTFCNYTESHDYVLYAQNGTAQLYKLSNGTDTGTKLPSPCLPSYGLAPSLSGISALINPPNYTSLLNKTILLTFWSESCITCVSAIPYLNALQEQYGSEGFGIISVYEPEFWFDENTIDVASQVRALGIKYPVGIDNNFTVWKTYDNKYLPTTLVVDPTGDVRYYAYGPLNYTGIETAIRSLEPVVSYTSPMVSSEVLNYGAQQPSTSSIYLGYSDTTTPPGNANFTKNEMVNYTLPSSMQNNTAYLSGGWYAAPDSIIADGNNSTLQLTYKARNLYVVAQGNESSITVTLDGNNIPMQYLGSSMFLSGGVATANLTAPTLYELVNGSAYAWHTIRINAAPTVRIYEIALD